MQTEILEKLQQVKEASRSLLHITDEQVAAILEDLADLLLVKKEFILQENEKDLARMSPDDPKYDRLLLNQQRLQDIANDLRKVASLDSPLGDVLEKRELSNGLLLSKVRVPLGVIGIVYESRPNVTFDVFALCLKSGNACVLKGSKDAHDSNKATLLLINEVLEKHDVDRNVVYLTPSEREALQYVLTADQLIDIVIPRGSQGLIDYVRANSKVPVIETGAGICHVYFDQTANLEQGKKIIINAKTRRVSVCNALDCLLLHHDRLNDLPEIVADMKDHSVEVYADAAAHQCLQGNYPDALLHAASEADFGKEWLSYKLSIKIVDDMDQALFHIARYSSKHSEAIVSEDGESIARFLKSVDAAVVYANASTAFTDGGQFGLGAEIGISTQKLHARGPMALQELTSYKWLVEGSGQVRA